MKNFIKISLLSLVFALTANLDAQSLPISVGIKGGVNASNVSTKNYKSKVGYNVGITFDLNLPSHLAIMTGLEVTSKGSKIKDENSKDWQMNSTYLQLPIHLGYKMNLMPGMTAHFNLGPYLAQSIGGKTKGYDAIVNEAGEITGYQKWSIKTSDNGIDKFDWGLGIGVGVTMLNKVQIRAGYDHGMKNIVKSKEAPKMRNRNVYASVGFLFF